MTAIAKEGFRADCGHWVNAGTIYHQLYDGPEDAEESQWVLSFCFRCVSQGDD